MEDLKILEGEKIKNIICEDVSVDDMEFVKQSSEKMIQLCMERGGLGLAAPQVGINKKFFIWMNTENSFEVVINPSYYPQEKKVTNVAESCLSLPEENNYIVKRYKKIRVVFYVYDNLNNKFIKFFRVLSDGNAFVWQHEIDHLYGKTIDEIGTLL